MTSPWLLDVFVLLFLLLTNGFFALAEIAVVSARKGRLRQLAEEGDKKAETALKLASEPTKFLSSVQVGVSLSAIFAGAYGGAALGDNFALWLAQFPLFAAYAKQLGFILVTGFIALSSLIIGELIPKSIALSNPEEKARWVAGPMVFFAKVTGPLISFLSLTTDYLLKKIGIQARAETPLSDEEITDLIEEGAKAGVFHKNEMSMVEGVLQLDDMPVTAIMTPRPKMIWLNLADSDENNWRKIVASGHSQFPVYQGYRDQIVGMISVKSLYANHAIGVKTHLRDLLVAPLYIPETLTAMQLLESFKRQGQHAALVVDEYGTVQGIVTLLDVMEAIVGDMPSKEERDQPEIRQREDGSWLIDATLTMDDLADRIGIELEDIGLVDEEEFQSVGSFILEKLQNIPRAGDYFDWRGWRFEVMDMDRIRVDKVLVRRIAPPATESASSVATEPAESPYKD